MRFVKAALLMVIAFYLVFLWAERDYLVAAYQQNPDAAPQVRLSGIDLAVTQTAIEPSPYAVPAAPDTRSGPPPVLALSADNDDGVPVVLTGGDAALRGTVLGPDGQPLAGATVEVQRHTTQGMASMVLATDEAGRWSVSALAGGRYRVRAWVPGLLTSGGSEVIFLAEDQSVDLAFALWGIDPSPELEFVHSGELYVDVPGTVAVVISQRTIDDQGVVLTVPVVGVPVTIQTTQHVTVLSGPVQNTGLDGAARFAVACPLPVVDPGAEFSPQPADGIGTLVARWDALVGGFALPVCVPAPTPEPEPESGPGSESGPATGQAVTSNG